MTNVENVISSLIQQGCISPDGLVRTEVGEIFKDDRIAMSGLIVAEATIYQAAITLLLDRKMSHRSPKHGLQVVARGYPSFKFEDSVLHEAKPISTVTVFIDQQVAVAWEGKDDSRKLYAMLDVAVPMKRR
jgi:hypothetical protein